jgi:hypothetical protein
MTLRQHHLLNRPTGGTGSHRGIRPSPLDQFIPRPDIAERFAIRVHAPAPLVLEVASTLDLQALPLVRHIFWLREKIMRATPRPRASQSLLQELVGLGWGLLIEHPGRLIVGGAACQPWQADVVFEPLATEGFLSYAEPDQVKIAWTLETEPLGPELTRFTTETRAVATDVAARGKFRRYWRWARFGIIAIRLLLLPTIRREAERRHRLATDASVAKPAKTVFKK